MLVSDRDGRSRGYLDGMGAALAGGRWSPRGKRAIYTSCRASTTLLELLVHTGGMLPATGRLYLVTLEIPDDCYESAYAPAPPPGWGELARDPRATVAIGEQWLATQEQLAMRVPSALSPLDFNVLLNPLHEDIATVEVVSKVPFLIDPNAFGGRRRTSIAAPIL
nr:RES family NAD+ phosphorylase [Trinickia acidisoli]